MIRLDSIKTWCSFTVLVFLLVVGAAAQSLDRVQMMEELRTRAGLTEDDFRRLEEGEIIIKKLERLARSEVALVGVVKVEFAYDLAKLGFERTVNTQKRESARENGRFGEPPSVGDLASLEFEEKDVLDLAECRVGSCEWNLPASTIDALRSGIDWNSADAAASASKILKDELVRYIKDYRDRGVSGLPEYRDTEYRVNLGDEYRSIAQSLMFVDRFDPGFGVFVRSYPEGRPEGATDFFNWSEVKIGFKPVVMVTHTLESERAEGDIGYTLNVSRQVFANHYFDASLGTIALFGFPASEGRPQSYIVFVNRSRASALRGKLGGLLRGLIEDQAKGKLEGFLSDTKKYTALASANRAAAAEREALRESESSALMSSSTKWILGGAAAIIVLVVFFLIIRRSAE